MFRWRAWFGGRTHPSNRSLDEQKEKRTLVTSLEVDSVDEGASLQTQMERPVRRKQRSVRKIRSNVAFIGPVLSRIRRNKPLTIQCLDDSLFARIYQYLPPVDQVCLALSCKRFFSRSKVFSKDSPTLPPQPTDRHLPLSHVNSQDKLRLQLLARLEDSRWAYCTECLVLKPRQKFTPEALNAPTLQRRCAHYDGLIRLCLCFHLTRRDRENMRRLLWSPDTACGVRYGCFGFKSDGWRLGGHVCPFYSNTYREMRISAQLSISYDGDLVFNAWYAQRVFRGDAVVVARPLFACPHLDLIPLTQATGDFTRCNQCHASIFKIAASPEDAGLVTFNVRFGLGWADEPNYYRWFAHCYFPAHKKGNSKHSRLYDSASLNSQSGLSTKFFIRSPTRDLKNGSTLWHGQWEDYPQRSISGRTIPDPVILRANLSDL